MSTALITIRQSDSSSSNSTLEPSKIDSALFTIRTVLLMTENGLEINLKGDQNDDNDDEACFCSY